MLVYFTLPYQSGMHVFGYNYYVEVISIAARRMKFLDAVGSNRSSEAFINIDIIVGIPL